MKSEAIASVLAKEFNHYRAHQDEFVEKYDGKYIVLIDGNVVGIYDDDFTAVIQTQRSHKLGTFLVQKVANQDSENIPRFYSGVVFP